MKRPLPTSGSVSRIPSFCFHQTRKICEGVARVKYFLVGIATKRPKSQNLPKKKIHAWQFCAILVPFLGWRFQHVTQTSQGLWLVTSNDRRSSLVTAWITYTPRKLTWNPQGAGFRRRCSFSKSCFFRFHMNFRGFLWWFLFFKGGKLHPVTRLDPVGTKIFPSSSIVNRPWFCWRVFPTPSPWWVPGTEMFNYIHLSIRTKHSWR